MDDVTHFPEVLGIVLGCIEPGTPAREDWLWRNADTGELLTPVLVLDGGCFDTRDEVVHVSKVAAHLLGAVVEQVGHTGDVEEPRVEELQSIGAGGHVAGRIGEQQHEVVSLHIQLLQRVVNLGGHDCLVDGLHGVAVYDIGLLQHCGVTDQHIEVLLAAHFTLVNDEEDCLLVEHLLQMEYLFSSECVHLHVAGTLGGHRLTKVHEELADEWVLQLVEQDVSGEEHLDQLSLEVFLQTQEERLGTEVSS